MSAMELKVFENQLELLSFSEQISIMEFLAKLICQKQKTQGVSSQTVYKKRHFGSAKGKFVYPEDFDEDNEEIAKLFGVV